MSNPKLMTSQVPENMRRLLRSLPLYLIPIVVVAEEHDISTMHLKVVANCYKAPEFSQWGYRL